MKVLIWVACALVAGTAIGLLRAFDVPLQFLWSLVIGGGCISVAASLCEWLDDNKAEKKRKEEQKRIEEIRRRPPPSQHR